MLSSAISAVTSVAAAGVISRSDVLTSPVDIKTKKEAALSNVAEHTKVEKLTQEQSVYYGADIVGGVWKVVTPPMNYETAVAWVYSTAEIGIYGKSTSWGIYTKNEADAYALAVALGGPLPMLHTNRAGEYPHYHVAAMIFFGRYKHFHIWYGAIYGE